MRKLLSYVVIAFAFSWAAQVNAAGLPAKVQANLILKILGFEKSTTASGAASIHVIDAPDVAAALESMVGRRAGKAKLTVVTQSSSVPSEKVSALYIGSESQLDEGLEYTHKNNVMSVTGNSALVDKGVTLGLGVEAGKPKFILNLSASKDEGLDWNPAILKIASAVN